MYINRNHITKNKLYINNDIKLIKKILNKFFFQKLRLIYFA